MTTFECEGKTYELKLTRAGVRAAEALGLTTSEMVEKPFSAVVMLFYAALYTQRVNPKQAEKMFDACVADGTFEQAAVYEELVVAYNELFGLGESE